MYNRHLRSHTVLVAADLPPPHPHQCKTKNLVPVTPTPPRQEHPWMRITFTLAPTFYPSFPKQKLPLFQLSSRSKHFSDAP